MSEFREKWPEMRMKHLELVQNAITRMGTNSAGLKGYCMGIVAALIALAGAIEKPRILFLGLPIIVAFAVLDASYLVLERGFRDQYNELRLKPLESEPDFHIEPKESATLADALLSWSVLGFYGAGILIVVAVGVFI
ncbi:hypothetical protein G7077_09205 [Sphingomonas piscis]|uniref:Uncharacterized protein n=1 Tax=Sphingomonas piscis TaxID=2714943 RepID=A0A6G7YQM8_9SPHN|nr:hypothetical protein [Sphingomonas piscis]QIK79043.1 hypothetical protein G7077_09205 [Sphingomonas piscis]